MENAKLSRRELSVKAALLLLGGATITLDGCASGTVIPTDRSASTISSNHGHVATVTSAQLLSGSELSLDIKGTASHSHTVVLTWDELMQIRDGVKITKASTLVFGHTHTVTFN